jgi:hypothetical protein
MKDSLRKLAVEVALPEIPTAGPLHDEGVQRVAAESDGNQTRIGNRRDFGTRGLLEFPQSFLIPIRMRTCPTRPTRLLNKHFVSEGVFREGKKHSRNVQFQQISCRMRATGIVIDSDDTSRRTLDESGLESFLEPAN